MSAITLRHEHALGRDEARKRVALFEQKLDEYGVRAVWQGDRADIVGTGFSGTLELGDGFVEVVVKLGFLARRVVDVARLESAIRKRLELAFGDDPPAL